MFYIFFFCFFCCLCLFWCFVFMSVCVCVYCVCVCDCTNHMFVFLCVWLSVMLESLLYSYLLFFDILIVF